jgi:hypothetical protein
MKGKLRGEEGTQTRVAISFRVPVEPPQYRVMRQNKLLECIQGHLLQGRQFVRGVSRRARQMLQALKGSPRHSASTDSKL